MFIRKQLLLSVIWLPKSKVRVRQPHPPSFNHCMLSILAQILPRVSSRGWFPKLGQGHQWDLNWNLPILSNAQSHCATLPKCFNNNSFSIFTERFKLASATYLYNTRSARNGLYNSSRFGWKSIVHSTVIKWNHLKDKLAEYDFLILTPKSLKLSSSKFLFTTAKQNYIFPL